MVEVSSCVDLRADFAGRYRFAWDEAYAQERPEVRRDDAAWLTYIPCRYGKTYPHGGRALAAYCHAGAGKRRELQGQPGVTITQGGPGCPEVIVTFPVERLAQIAAIMGAKRPRQVSPAQRKRLLAMSAPFRYRARSVDSTDINLGK